MFSVTIQAQNGLLSAWRGVSFSLAPMLPAPMTISLRVHSGRMFWVPSLPAVVSSALATVTVGLLSRRPRSGLPSSFWSASLVNSKIAAPSYSATMPVRMTSPEPLLSTCSTGM